MQDFAFVSVKFHFPCACPILEVIQIVSKVTSVLLCQYSMTTFASSANISIQLVTTPGMPLMNSPNIIGDMTLPCGNPEITLFHAELSPFITTICLRFDKKCLHHPGIFPVIPVLHLHQQSLVGHAVEGLGELQIYCIYFMTLVPFLCPLFKALYQLCRTFCLHPTLVRLTCL